jgi:hypothetical protein
MARESKCAGIRRGRSRLIAASTEKFAGEGSKKLAAPDSDNKDSAEKENRVEAGAAFAGPVDTFLKVKPEGELVEGESGADSIKKRHQAAGEQGRRLGSCADFNQKAESYNQKQEDAPNEMVDVRTANVNVMKRADIATSSESHRASYGEGEKESDGGKEKAAPGTIADVLMK